MAPGISPFTSPNSSSFLQYANDHDPSSCWKALKDLEEYIAEEGPFDAVMAFSQGAGLAASLLIHYVQRDAQQAQFSPVFRCAVFFSGGVPEDPRGVEAAVAIANSEKGGEKEESVTTTRAEGNIERRLMDGEIDGEVIMIPTAHIWGRNDDLYPTFGPVLSRLCKSSEREVFLHEGGHEIVGAKDPIALEKAVRCIQRAIMRADLVQ
ncbi:MAG: hypothetical protein Q9213_002769 [Squamulea squamosa]